MFCVVSTAAVQQAIRLIFAIAFKHGALHNCSEQVPHRMCHHVAVQSVLTSMLSQLLYL